MTNTQSTSTVEIWKATPPSVLTRRKRCTSARICSKAASSSAR